MRIHFIQGFFLRMETNLFCCKTIKIKIEQERKEFMIFALNEIAYILTITPAVKEMNDFKNSQSLLVKKQSLIC